MNHSSSLVTLVGCRRRKLDWGRETYRATSWRQLFLRPVQCLSRSGGAAQKVVVARKKVELQENVQRQASIMAGIAASGRGKVPGIWKQGNAERPPPAAGSRQARPSASEKGSLIHS